MRHTTRRQFLEDSLFAAAAAAAVSAVGTELRAETPNTPNRAVGPNDKIRLAVIGVGGRGLGSHVAEFLNQPDVTIAAVCDADSARQSAVMKRFEAASLTPPTFVQDMRRIFEDKSIDAVSIATTNHWHSLAAIWAMQAGKHVYVEKPASHNVFEGRTAVAAARKNNLACQTGSQIRSNPGVREGIQYLRDGKLGKVHLARALCYKRRGSIGKVDGEQPVTKSVDYDLWSGPAPIKPVLRKNFHYDWHWIWDYGNGDLGNQGVHQMDIARWGLGKDTLAKGVIGFGGRFGYEDDGETPNTQLVFLDYGDSELIFEVRGLQTERLRGADIGVIFYCSEGYMVVDSYTHSAVFDRNEKLVAQFKGGADKLHFRNFLDAVRSGKPELLNADILDGHLSAALCHLGNISYRLGSPQPFDAKTKAFGDDKEAYETFGRFEKHLADNGIKMETSQYTLGRRLTVDTKREAFIDDDAANAMLTREYREPFVVPKMV